MKYLLQCLWALAALWHEKTIARRDRLLLFKKTVNLFICFLAFTDTRRPRRQLRAAMQCALLSAIYDYETDWVRVPNLSSSIYLRLLTAYVPDIRIREGATQLFERDWSGNLSEHGLERGSSALTFYHAVINAEWLSEYSATEIARYGRALQIVDDLIDLEYDRAKGDTNCLLVDNAEQYHREARMFLEGPFYKALEDHAAVYRLLRVRCLNVLDTLSSDTVRDCKAAVLLKRVHDDMLRRDPKKYGDWLKRLEAGRTFVKNNPFALKNPFFKRALERLRFIDLIYGVGRKADDIADDDAPLPPGWTSASDYIAHLVEFLRSRNTTDDELEFLLGYVLDVGEGLGIDPRREIELVLRSLLFDARRRESPRLVIVPRAELDGNNFLLDEEGTIGLCLLILGETRESFAAISLLGIATRIMYTLRDLREDMGKRLCNVPREDFDAFGMYVPDVTSAQAIQDWYDSGPVRAWRAKEAQRGLELYRKYDAVRDNLQVHDFTRAILEYLYERSTKAGLEDVLKAA